LWARVDWYDNGTVTGTAQNITAGTWYHFALYYNNTDNAMAWYWGTTITPSVVQSSASITTTRNPSKLELQFQSGLGHVGFQLDQDWFSTRSTTAQRRFVHDGEDAAWWCQLLGDGERWASGDGRIIVNVSWIASVSEQAILADASISALEIAAQVAEGLVLAEAADGSLLFNVSALDGVTVSDAGAAVVTSRRFAADGVTVEDAASVLAVSWCRSWMGGSLGYGYETSVYATGRATVTISASRRR